jgi:hypothetical protein
MGGVRLAVIDRTPQTTYEHGRFGTTFDQRIARWLATEFRRIGVVSGTGPGARTIEIWKRSPP